MKGSISRDGKIVASNLDIDIRTQTRGGLKDWYGSFSIDHSIALDEDEYALELADGRSGRILISSRSVTAGSSATVVRFTGTGPLG